MRILFIAAFLIGCGWLGWRGWNRIIHPDERKPAVEAAPVTPPPLPVAKVEDMKPADAPPLLPGAPVRMEAVGVYVFKNRPVPPTPFGRATASVGTQTDAKGLELSVDQGSNSWLMRGTPDAVDETKRIGAFIDIEQQELDLDFCLVGVSSEWMRRFGIQAAYQSGASWVPAFTLGGAGDTLRISSGNFSLNVDAELADNSARVVSSPVVRCVTGELWEFSADESVPVATMARSEGVVSTAYEYQNIGLGFSGTVFKAGPPGSFRLTVEQRNGSVVGDAATTEVPPRLKSQLLKSSLVVQVGRWSCIGGVTSWKVEHAKRLLGVSDSEEQELLLVFVRARDSLEVAPQAYPVGPPPGHLGPWTAEPWDWDADENPLLPNKNWRERLDAEIDRVEKDIRQRLGHPAK